MTISIGFLGPAGTYAESAALACADWLRQQQPEAIELQSMPSIPQTIQAAASGHQTLAVVPVENSIEGSVTTTLDTLWQFDRLQVQQAFVLPISHALLSSAASLSAIQAVYSHPQALAQCQHWLATHLPQAQLVPTHSNTEPLQSVQKDPTIAGICSQRAAALYQLPILAHPINDHPDNYTRFWALGLRSSTMGVYTSLGFSVADQPGALVKLLQIFAEQGINLCRLESRPTKRLLGEYRFFVDIEASLESAALQLVIQQLQQHTEALKIFGSYSITAALADNDQLEDKDRLIRTRD